MINVIGRCIRLTPSDLGNYDNGDPEHAFFQICDGTQPDGTQGKIKVFATGIPSGGGGDIEQMDVLEVKSDWLVCGGNITVLTLISSGSGYITGTHALTFTSTSGTGAAGTYTVDSGGTVSTLNLTNSGSGYLTAPVVGFSSPGSGTSASAIATVQNTNVALPPLLQSKTYDGKTVVLYDGQHIYAYRQPGFRSDTTLDPVAGTMTLTSTSIIWPPYLVKIGLTPVGWNVITACKPTNGTGVIDDSGNPVLWQDITPGRAWKNEGAVCYQGVPAFVLLDTNYYINPITP